MPAINSTTLSPYKKYYTEDVIGKDGIKRPITKVKYIKPCEICGGEMTLTYRKGGVFKREYIKWDCSDNICKHSEREESEQEYLERTQ